MRAFILLRMNSRTEFIREGIAWLDKYVGKTAIEELFASAVQPQLPLTLRQAAPG